MTVVDLSSILLQNPQSPKFASNQAAGGRTLFPLKFTPAVVRSGEEPVGTIISGSTFPCVCQKVGKVADGTKAYSAFIAAGGYQPWGWREYFPNPVSSGTVVNLQWSLYFPADYNWEVNSGGGGRLKFLRISRRCTDFKYVRCSGVSGIVPPLGTALSSGGGSGLFAGVVERVNGVSDIRANSLAEGATIPANSDIRLTNTTGNFTDGAFSFAGISGSMSGGIVDGEGYIDVYLLNGAFSGVNKDGLLLLETENYGAINSGNFIDTTAKLEKGRWETIEVRVVLDATPMSMGGSARIQLWQRIGQQMILACDIQNVGTLARNTSQALDMILFNYWNGSSPASQTMYLDRMVMHFDPTTLVDTCPSTGVKLIGGVSP